MKRNENNYMNLTVGITCYYKTDFHKFVNQVKSLFDNRFTPNIKSIITPEINITPIEKVELIFVIDNYPVKDKYLPKKYADEYENNINNILNYIKTLKIYNTKITVFKTQFNCGVSVSRNIIIKKAKSKFLCFCDDDDLHINVNETLKIIRSNYNYKCINCHMSKRKNEVVFEQSNISPCSGIYEVNYLRTHKIYFPEGIKTEDIIWRSKLYKQLSNEKCNSIIEVDIGLYIALDPSNSSTEIKTKDNLRNPNSFNRDSYIDLPSNQITYNKLNTIETVNYNEWDIFALTSSLNINHGSSLLLEYIKNNIQKFDSHHKKLYNLTQSLNDYLFDFKYIHDKIECFRLYLKYLSLQDFKYLSEYISDQINETHLDTFNVLWKLDKGIRQMINIKYNRILLKITNFISTNEIEIDQFKNFCFRYVCLKYIQHGEYKDNLKRNTINKLNELKTYHENVFRNMNINDVVLYLSYNVKYIIDQNIPLLNEYKTKFIKTKNNAILMKDLKKYFDSKYDILIEKYVSDNSFETVDLFSNSYRGFMTITLLYILSPKLTNEIKHYNTKIKVDNNNDLIYTQEYSGWFNWIKYMLGF